MKKIICIAALTLIIISCKKEFIDIIPYSTATTSLLYKTDKDYQDAIIGIYGSLRSAYNDFWQFSDLRADDVSCRPAEGSSLAIDRFYINSDLGVLNSSWRSYYQMIFLSNTILTAIEKADVSIVKNKDQYIGETKFLRALAYFDLVRIFGDVPMVTSVLTTEQAMKTPREKVDKIYDEIIIKDLQDAESLLPATYTATNVGRPTSGAVKSLLGMVYLTRKDFVKAEAKLQEVTTMGYALLPKYTDLFDFTKDEHHKEYIFDVEYISGGLGVGSNFTNQFMDNRGDLLKYYKIAGIGGQSGSPSEEYFTLFDPADTRKVYYRYIIQGLPDGTPMVPIDLTTYTTKYVVPITIAGDSPANWKVIRYANVLLMYAEALNENGKTTQALTYLNQVRTRAGVANFSALTQSDTREKIYLERRLEFYLEGQRWFDLVRTGRALSVMGKLGMKDYMTVFPIPQRQMQVVNDPAILFQNPGYD
jgi:starch-binding outer membrane protein, SusD/RagB family